MSGTFLIVGGSHAACQMAASARQSGYDGSIVVLTEEADLPYHRPPLSKAYLDPMSPTQELPLKPEAYYQKELIDVRLNSHVSRLDLSDRTVSFDRRKLKFDTLGVATGARARKLSTPGSDLEGVLYLRSLADAKTLKTRARSVSEVIVVGGGFIGLEVALTLSKQGKGVTVIEAQPRPLARVVSEAVSGFLVNAHTGQGVKVLTNRGVRAITGHQRVSGVVFDDGTELSADMVIVGIGAFPNIQLARAAALGPLVRCIHGRTGHGRRVSLADRVSVLVRGATIASGSPDEIRQNSDVQAAYIGHKSK
jgi:3-phenylpropionate/trans-cinnamate dioxygenase ferredoxin reductase component